MGRGHWVTNVCYSLSKFGLHFEHEIAKAVVIRYPVSFEFSMPRSLHCWQIKGSCRCKTKHSQIAILKLFDDSVPVEGKPNLRTL